MFSGFLSGAFETAKIWILLAGKFVVPKREIGRKEKKESNKKRAMAYEIYVKGSRGLTNKNNK